MNYWTSRQLWSPACRFAQRCTDDRHTNNHHPDVTYVNANRREIVMRDAIALRRYLQRHAETDLPSHTFTAPHWRQVLVIPAYRESPALLDRLARLPAGIGRTLVILVLNRPDSDGDPLANAELRDALSQLHFPQERLPQVRLPQVRLPQAMRDTVLVYCLNPHTDLHLYDMEMLRGPTPGAQGVGLARKTGCDIALQWMAAGGISGQWLCSTDADATLPPEYFALLESVKPDAVAAVFPFRHVPGDDEVCNSATALYELRLHHYVLGLEYANSPYAFHTLGSCLAVRSAAYAHAHGFPKRAGAEDFYLLNKLAKLGAVARLQGDCIELQSRHSSRVPFGTGPAVAAIMAAEHPDDAALFYHPQCFEALAAVLASLPALAAAPEQDIARLLHDLGLQPLLARDAESALATLGIAAALAHCRRQSSTDAQFQRHFHQWFDGFRTLKFIHALRDAGWSSCSLRELEGLAPQLWPQPESHTKSLAAEGPHEVEKLRHRIRQHWGWQ
jgi:hypothetical protein